MNKLYEPSRILNKKNTVLGLNPEDLIYSAILFVICSTVLKLKGYLSIGILVSWLVFTIVLRLKARDKFLTDFLIYHFTSKRVLKRKSYTKTDIKKNNLRGAM